MSSEQEPTPIAMTLVRMKHRVEGPYLLVGLDSWEEQLWITWTTPEEAQRQAESARHYAEAWTDEETEDWVLVPSAVRAAEQERLAQLDAIMARYAADPDFTRADVTEAVFALCGLAPEQRERAEARLAAFEALAVKVRDFVGTGPLWDAYKAAKSYDESRALGALMDLAAFAPPAQPEGGPR